VYSDHTLFAVEFVVEMVTARKETKKRGWG
jgi:hypothetical protein